MFYLGSIAGILPYLLAFSLTILLGGHVRLPFHATPAAPETIKEIVEEKSLSVENLKKGFAFEKQAITRRIVDIKVFVNTSPKVFNRYLFRYFDSGVLGLSLLRAPPISLN